MKKGKSPKTKTKTKMKKIVMVSGGFDPVHIGHVRLFQEAKERKEIIEALACVDGVILTGHRKNTKDISVCKELAKIRPHVFANGGDRYAENIPEYEICRKLGIQMVFNVGKGGKIRSSSLLLKEYADLKRGKGK